MNYLVSIDDYGSLIIVDSEKNERWTFAMRTKWKYDDFDLIENLLKYSELLRRCNENL